MVPSSRFFDIYQLPERREMFLADWDVVFMPDQTKNLLLAYVNALSRLQPVKSPGLALRRAVLLYGPPGCGKTSLARGLPAKWSIVSGAPKAGFIHVNTHALFSGIRGEGQKNVLAAFQQIAEQATSGYPIFVLVDEVETLGSDRASISLEANPLDALYQVTAFFESLDRYARELPNVIFIFTTNIPKAIDRAVRERVDFVVEIPLPDAQYRSMILIDAIESLSSVYDVADLLRLARASPSPQAWTELVSEADGLSGRALRHVLVVAATLAADSRVLQPDHLRQALAQVAQAEEGLRKSGGTYVESYQEPAAIRANAPPAARTVKRVASATWDAVDLGDAVLDEIAKVRGELAQVQAEVAGLRETLRMWRLERQHDEATQPIGAPASAPEGSYPYPRG